MNLDPPVFVLAPEGRHVPPRYGRHENWNVSNRSCIRRGWVPQPIGRGNLSPTIDTAPPIVSHLAPEGRHVAPRYGRHENWNVSNRSWIRRGWVPQPVGRGNLAPTMDTAPPILPHLPPEGRQVAPGYGRHKNWNVSNRSCMRRGWVSQPIGRGNLSLTIDTAPPILPHLAPEGRHVPPGYGRHENWNVSNRSCIRRGWVPQPIGRGNLSPTIDTAPPIVSHLAPEGRHVYRIRHTTNNQSPRGATYV